MGGKGSELHIEIQASPWKYNRRGRRESAGKLHVLEHGALLRTGTVFLNIEEAGEDRTPPLLSVIPHLWL